MAQEQLAAALQQNTEHALTIAGLEERAGSAEAQIAVAEGARDEARAAESAAEAEASEAAALAASAEAGRQRANARLEAFKREMTARVDNLTEKCTIMQRLLAAYTDDEEKGGEMLSAQLMELVEHKQRLSAENERLASGAGEEEDGAEAAEQAATVPRTEAEAHEQEAKDAKKVGRSCAPSCWGALLSLICFFVSLLCAMLTPSSCYARSASKPARRRSLSWSA